VVVKVGSSSVTLPDGGVDEEVVRSLSAQVAALRSKGHAVVLVTSGAIAAGWAALGGGERPRDLGTLQAVSAVGQHLLMRVYQDALGELGMMAGQVLLAPYDFANRSQYLHARQTLSRLIDMDVVPVVNENDATSDEEIRFGDNDRLAALVAHLVAADLLVLLTDTAGLFTGDPRLLDDASLIEEVVEVDKELEAYAGGASSEVGSGGMASKLQAAKIAAWSGVETVIADATRPGVLADALSDRPGVGTRFRARPVRLPARKLWIAFALPSSGTIVVDQGAMAVLVRGSASLLPAGVVGLEGEFKADDAVEIAGPDGTVFAKGIVRHASSELASWAGRRTSELPPEVPEEVVHRDDLVVMSTVASTGSSGGP
jgi:glutamate 5-kinase